MIQHTRMVVATTLACQLLGCGLLPVAETSREAAVDPAAAWDAMLSREDAARRAHDGAMTCDAAIAIALANNFDLRARRAERGIASAQLFAAGLLRDPELDLRVLATGGGEASLLFDVLQDLRQRPKREAVASAAATVIDLEIAAEEWKVAIAVEAAYLATARAVARHTLLERQRAAAATEADAGRKSHQVGEVGAIAVLEAESIVADLDLEILSAEAERSTARSELCRLLGLAPDTAFELAPPVANPSLPDRAAALSALATARFDLRILEREYRRAEAEWALARGEGVALPSLGPALEADAEGTAFGVDLAWSVPLFAGNRGAIAEAAARLVQLGDEYVARLHDAKSEVEAAFVAAELTRRRSDTWQNELLPRTRQVIEFVQTGVRVGQIPVLEASRRMREALARERSALDADFDHREALLAVRRATGPISSP